MPDGLLRDVIRTLRHAQHERKALDNSIGTPFVLRFSKDERRGFQQTVTRLRGVPVGLMMLVLFILSAGSPAEVSGQDFGVGHSALESDITAWNIDVSPDGQGLPPGQGMVKQGAQIYAMKCSACHGPTGQEGPNDVLVGGQGSLRTSKPLKTIGSYWPYATTLYDYLRRAMPFTAPQSLKPDEIYALVAWLLYQNQIIAEDAMLDAQSLPKVEMPNRHGFIPDSRPDVR